jgi:hypothetical protein
MLIALFVIKGALHISSQHWYEHREVYIQHLEDAVAKKKGVRWQH